MLYINALDELGNENYQNAKLFNERVNGDIIGNYKIADKVLLSGSLLRLFTEKLRVGWWE